MGYGSKVFTGPVFEALDFSSKAFELSPLLPPAKFSTRIRSLTSPGKALGWFMAAVRETFEETSLPLAAPNRKAPQSKNRLRLGEGLELEKRGENPPMAPMASNLEHLSQFSRPLKQ